MYSRFAFFNSLITIARRLIAGLGIPGSMLPAEIVEVVTWLLKSEAWKFSGLDIVVSLQNEYFMMIY